MIKSVNNENLGWKGPGVVGDGHPCPKLQLWSEVPLQYVIDLYVSNNSKVGKDRSQVHNELCWIGLLKGPQPKWPDQVGDAEVSCGNCRSRLINWFVTILHRINHGGA